LIWRQRFCFTKPKGSQAAGNEYEGDDDEEQYHLQNDEAHLSAETRDVHCDVGAQDATELDDKENRWKGLAA
jgi:hypothetical protein